MFAPVLIYLIFGLAEMGLFFRTYISVSAALADGSRQGSILGSQLDVDYQILQAVKVGLASVPTSDIKVLVVFDAGFVDATNPAKASPPAACAQTGVASPVSLTSIASKCNAYTPGTDWTATDKRLYGCVVNPPFENNRSAGWCPDRGLTNLPPGRKDAATAGAGNGPPDYLGLYIRIDHTFLTGFFGKTKTVEQTFVARLEPQSLA
jgi:hypothetical protein